MLKNNKTSAMTQAAQNPQNSRTTWLLGLSLGLALALPGAAQAVVTDETASQCNPEAYILADGHEAIAPDSLFPADWYSDRVFPGQDKAQMSAPDSTLDAATRTMLLLEQREPTIERARWTLDYRVLAGSTEEPELNACTLVELRRYNLTGQVHAQLLRDSPEASPAGPGEEARLPHVSWRFWLTTTQGMQADVMAAARRTLTDAEAANTLCLGKPCLKTDALQALLDQPGTRDWTPDSQAPQASYHSRWPEQARSDQAMTSPARAVQELFHTALSSDSLPFLFQDDPDNAPLRLLLERNINGQEDYLGGILQQRGLLDDSISEVWTQRLETPGFDSQSQVHWQQRPLCRRSEQPPCP